MYMSCLCGKHDPETRYRDAINMKCKADHISDTCVSYVYVYICIYIYIYVCIYMYFCEGVYAPIQAPTSSSYSLALLLFGIVRKL